MQINPKAKNKGISRVFRGGSWHCRNRVCRSASRYFDYISGLRIVMGVKKDANKS